MAATTKGRKRPGKQNKASAPLVRGLFVEDQATERALISGEHAATLEGYFGEGAHAHLRALAQEAATRRARGGARVLILPGIMGSTLGVPHRFLDDVLWLDPVAMAAGQITKLTLGSNGAALKPLGVVLFAYLKLKLSLQIEGFDAAFHPFDWRRDIAESGKELAARLGDEAKGGRKIFLVAHSMGGLVARSALMHAAADRAVEKLIMLGTPNFGSFVACQALRGSYSVVRTLATLDLRHSAEEIAANVLSTFPGLHQMLPAPDKVGLDLFRLDAWPSVGPRPRAALLTLAQRLGASLCPPQPRMTVIAGINRETTTSAVLDGGDFVYTTSRAGDGTVPLVCARLPDVTTYYVDEDHGNLANNGTVTKAVVDLLRGPSTRALPTTWHAPGANQPVRSTTDRSLASTPTALEGKRTAELSRTDQRELIAELVAPLRVPTVAEATGATPPASPTSPATTAWDEIVVGRRRQRRLDITLARGSITEVNARAYVLGVFRHVTPTGPALEIDRRLDGAVTELGARRMLTGVVGQAFVLPIGRSTLRADMILFAGLGTFDTFGPDVQELVAENVVRVFTRTHVEEFATLLLGTSSGASVGDTLRAMLSGFLRALRDVDGGHRFRRIIFCERDEGRYTELKRCLYDLVSTPLFADVEVTLAEEKLPTALTTVAASDTPTESRKKAAAPDPVYLMVRQASRQGGQDGASSGTAPPVVFETALLGSGGKAAVIAEEARFSQEALDRHLAFIESPKFAFDTLPAFGEKLAALVLPLRTRQALASMRERPLILVHDAPSSRVPWEVLRIQHEGATFSPALEGGLTRRYLAANLSIAKWLEARRRTDTLHILLVSNPTGDLPGADQEGERLSAALGQQAGVRITALRGQAATRPRMLDELRSGAYDVVHYAGHAFFDAEVPERSGVLCAGREVLTGADLASLSSLPSLVVFNACEAARIRRGTAKADEGLSIAARLRRTTSFAEAALRGGVANYVGTYWPVHDDAALLFATTFYGRLLQGATVAGALIASRQALEGAKMVDWADYIHYGSPDFVIKDKTAPTD